MTRARTAAGAARGTAAGRPPGLPRRLWRVKPLRFAVLGAACLLIPAGWLVAGADGPPGGCPKPGAAVSPSDLYGTYRGPSGARLTLAPGAERDAGAAEVRDWPFALSNVVDGKLAAGADGRVRRFDGAGEWTYGDVETADGTHPGIELRFTRGTPEDDTAAEDQALVAGGTPAEPVLFEAPADPDSSCPDAVFRR